MNFKVGDIVLANMRDLHRQEDKLEFCEVTSLLYYKERQVSLRILDNFFGVYPTNTNRIKYKLPIENSLNKKLYPNREEYQGFLIPEKIANKIRKNYEDIKK